MKTLAEIAIEAGLVNRAAAGKAGHIAEERKLPLVVVLVRELGVDEVALVAALRKQTRVPLGDPGEIRIAPDASRVVAKDVCARLRLVPIAVTTEGATRVLRIAMADPTDTAAIAELQHLTRCEIDVIVLPLSAIDELVASLYRQTAPAVVSRPDNLFVTRRPRTSSGLYDSEVSVTAQIPMASLNAGPVPDPLELRVAALQQLLIAKGLITEEELADALRRVQPAPTPSDGAPGDKDSGR